jgi:hypothetical protein
MINDDDENTNLHHEEQTRQLHVAPVETNRNRKSFSKQRPETSTQDYLVVPLQAKV